jgi:hypothetical protein
MNDWRPESMRVLDEATACLMGLLTFHLRLREDERVPLEEALDDFVKAHIQRDREERRELGYDR